LILNTLAKKLNW